MKLTCNKKAFTQTFLVAAATAAVRDIKAVFQNVKLIANDNQLIFMATDLDNAIRLELVGAQVVEPGEVILPTKLLKEILSVCTDEEFSLQTEGDVVSFFDGRYSNIPTINVQEFPNIDLFETEAYHIVDSAVLRQMIHRTSFAIEHENVKYALGGVLFEMGENRFATVATDGRRMANQEGNGEQFGGHFSENKAIVQPQTMNLIDKIFSASDEKVRVALDNDRVYFMWGNSMLRSRLIDGRFPRWRSIVPEPTDRGRTRVDMMVGPLLQLVREAEIPKTDKQPGLLFTFADGRLTLSARGSERGESKLSIPIAYEANPIQIKLEPRFVIDCLKVLDKDVIISLYVMPEKAVLFMTEDGYRYVLMPMS